MWLSKEQKPQKVPQCLSAGGRPIHTKGQLVTEADSTSNSAAWLGLQSCSGRGGFPKAMEAFSPACTLGELLNHGHAAGKITAVQ